MFVKQIHELVNATTQEVLGETGIIQEDFTNLVDVGNEIFNSDSVDNYVKKLVNRIGKTVFDNRKYQGNVPSVLMDSWEYGSVLQKISAELPEATVNESWQLEDGKEYKTDIFYQPKVSAKFFNNRVTFEIPMSFTERQVKESFNNSTELNGFIAMLTTAVENAITVKLNDLIMNTINNFTAETLYQEIGLSEGGALKAGSGVRAVNLKTVTGFKGTLSEALTDSDFIKKANHTINTYKSRLTTLSTLFNVGGKAKFTNKDELNLVLLSEFASASDVYLSADTINRELVEVANYSTVPFWQGSGLTYSLDDTTKIEVKTSEGNIVNTSGVLGVMFDKQALGVSNLDRRVTTNYNPKAEFYTNFYKVDSGYFNDFNENFVVFYFN